MKTGWRHLAYYAFLSALVDVLFVVVYFGADSITARRTHHLHLFLRHELDIPLWPSMILVYDSLYLLFLLVPFVLRTRDELRRLAVTLSGTIVASGIVFLLLPARLGFAPAVVTGPLKTIFEISDKLNRDYNLVPSLHVSLAVVCLLAMWPNANRPLRTALAIWGVALVFSTLLTHQHHILDAAAGAALAWAMFQSIYLRKVSVFPGRRELHAE